MNSKRQLMIDIETYSDIDIADAGAFKYAQSPAFEILLFAYKFDDHPTQIVDLKRGEEIPREVIDALSDESITKKAYNAAFEWYCLNCAGIITPLEQWECTMVHALYNGYPSGLAATGNAIGLPEDKKKMSVGKALIRYFCMPCKATKTNGGRLRNLPHHEPEKWSVFKDYCIQDVEAEYAIDLRLADFPMPEAEWDRWHRDTRMQSYGVKLDRELIDGALEIDAVSTENLLQTARELTGLSNPKSNAQMLQWVQAQGVNTDNLRKETVSDLLDRDDLPGIVREALELRSQFQKTSVTKFAKMKETMGTFDRCRGLIQFYGANRTGRYAGRLVQVQNLPRNYMDDLDEARTLVKAADYKGVLDRYGNVPDTLSQLIRTAFIPSEGHKFIVSDFSAIEARVVAWLAGEEWVLDVFRNNGDIYCATASNMFGVPVEKHGVNGDLRQKGKIATLALGYQGGVGSLKAMGALKMGIDESELQGIVDMWRQANPHIVQMWWDIERTTRHTITTGETLSRYGLTFRLEMNSYGTVYLTIQLPSGRKLFYNSPRIDYSMDSRGSIVHFGQNQMTKKWELQETYGGKLVENCLTGDTLVLTKNGIKYLRDISPEDKLWDGSEWVKHDELINKGIQTIINIDGVRMTPEHKIRAEKGWVRADESEGLNRYEVPLPRGDRSEWFRWSPFYVERKVQRLWKSDNNALLGNKKGTAEILRMYEESVDIKCEKDSRPFSKPDMECMAQHETEVRKSDGSGMEELRGQRDNRLQRMVGIIRGVFRGYGRRIRHWIDFRQNRCEWELLQGELQVGVPEKASTKQENQRVCKQSVGQSNYSRSLGTFRNRRIDAVLQNRAWGSGKYAIHSAGCKEQVYDIRNCGPRHCFTVLGDDGLMLVHNCVQAIARDCLVVTMNRVEDAGYRPVMHIHDEIVIDALMEETLDDVNGIFARPIDWAPGLPLKGDGFEGDYYKKD